MATLNLSNGANRIAEEMPIRLKDINEAHNGGMALYLGAVLATMALIALCWLLYNNSLQKPAHLQRMTSVPTASTIADMQTPANGILDNFSHSGVPTFPILNDKAPRPWQ